MKIEMTVGCL